MLPVHMGQRLDPVRIAVNAAIRILNLRRQKDGSRPGLENVRLPLDIANIMIAGQCPKGTIAFRFGPGERRLVPELPIEI